MQGPEGMGRSVDLVTSGFSKSVPQPISVQTVS